MKEMVSGFSKKTKAEKAQWVAETFASGPDAPYVALPIDLGIEVEPFGLVTRAGSSLPPVVLRMIEMVTAKAAFN